MFLYMREAPKKGANYGFFYIERDIFRRKDSPAKLFIFPNNIGIELSGEENPERFDHLIMILEGLEV